MTSNAAYKRLWRARRKELGITEHSQMTKENWAKRMIRQIRHRCKKSGREFDITSDDIQIPEFCPVLGIPLIVGIGQYRNPNSPSLDRFDNNKGYTKDNIRVISWRANYLKGSGSLEELKKVVQYMEGVL